ncbi:hypothetical protein SDRG_16435 [Saprolegnia diclina VS20]|uniref:Phosphoglycerate mutase n=1 Tax=Saprolegnia diclina (strain VS20) TaxID=1156394 RepID=T0R876_SAPDV|nr:hypothetical protein SDRG_16435 [Saprolegnia diclina VS20]EQC25697.1 hypothetical protein SDRG_16435 [Saprolegnia diclina VS20]|eukprot:XP_008620867.1 hypothetical protein SDRG_16435 [Saprolegnia diclina VS20]
MVELWLVRHGATEWNTEGRWQGQTDVPLSAVGQAQALALGDHLRALHASKPFDAIVSSDLSRAADTARAIGSALTLPVALDEQLREEQYGVLEGHTAAEMQADPILLAAWRARKAGRPSDGAESRADFYERVGGALEALRLRTGRVLVVAHGSFIINCYRHVHGHAIGSTVIRQGRCPRIGNTSLSILHGSPATWAVARCQWGLTPHLAAGDSSASLLDE